MRDAPIRSARDPRLLGWAERSRGDGDLVVLDGPKLVTEALGSGVAAEGLLLGDALDAATADRLRGLAGALPVVPIESRLEKPLTGSTSPRGTILLVRRPPPPSLPALRSPRAVIVVLDGVQDPGNAGAIARVAEAAGVAALLFSPGCARAFSPRTVRASAGAMLRLPIVEGVAGLPGPGEAEGWNQVALEAGGARRITDPLPPRPLAIVAGAEGTGLSGRFPLAEPRSIPMLGRGGSLSVLSAVTVALWVASGFVEMATPEL